MIKAGIDLGAGSIRLVDPEDGVIFDEAAVIAVDEKGHCLAYGDEALEMKGVQDSQIHVKSTVTNGKVDLDVLETLLDQLFYQFKLLRMFKKTVLVLSYPDTLSADDCSRLKDRLLSMGVYKVYFDKEIWMSAIGAGLDLSLPVSSCVMNMGFGNCDIAVFSEGRMRKESSARAAGLRVRKAIRNWIRQTHCLAVSDMTLEQINRELGCTRPHPNPRSLEITGFDIYHHTPRNVIITENDVAQALGPLCEQWARWIADFLMTLDENERQDVRMRGIVCCGGTMKLEGLDAYLQSVLGCPVYVTDNPATTVSRGLQILLERIDD